MSEPTAEIADLLAGLRLQTAQLRAAQAEVEREREAYRAAHAKQDAEHARRARAGELGPQWREIQQQIDLGRTSIGAVMSGEDGSAAAAALRADAARNTRQMGEKVEELAEDDPEVALATFGDHVRARTELQEALARVRELGLL